jgi:hypothetical protein
MKGLLAGLILASILIATIIFSEKAFGQHAIKNIPSTYSNDQIVVDGQSNDWNGVINSNQQPVPFYGTSFQSTTHNTNPNILNGLIYVRNNDTHASFFMIFHAVRPIYSTPRSVTILFDENGDGVSKEGDNYVIVGTKGRWYSPYMMDGYINNELQLDFDPSLDTKTFTSALRYINETDIAVELSVPFKDTNDFYDFGMLVPHTFTFILGYTAGDENSVDNNTISYQDSSSFATGFSYEIAQNPATVLLPGIISISSFLAGVAITSCSLYVVMKKKLKNQKGHLTGLVVVPKDKRIGIIVLLIFLSSIIIVTVNPVVLDKIVDNFIAISNSFKDQNLVQVISYSAILGSISSIICIIFLRQAQNLLSGIARHQQLLLKVSIVMFVFIIIPVAATPIMYLIVGIPAVLKDEPLVESLKLYINVLQDFMDSGMTGIITSPMFMSLSICIPTAFLIYVLYELRNSSERLRSKYKILLISFSVFLFIGIAVWNLIGLFVPLSDKINYSSMLFGPTISAIILSFLATRGYVSTIQESLNKLGIKISSSKVSLVNGGEGFGSKTPRPNVVRNTSVKSIAMALLILSVIGLAKNLFLISIPFIGSEFPLGYSLINDTFLRFITSYTAMANLGEGLEAAKIVYNNFVVFFSFFWIYDIIMIFRGFGEGFLNPKYPIYKGIRKYSGPLAAMGFLGLMILFAVGQATIDFRANEINIALPEWVRKQIGIQSNEIHLLSDLASQLGFLVGIATLTGLLYILARSKLYSKIQLRNVTNLQLKHTEKRG